ncbi:hypothetical protein CPB84DRAFT_1844311 [Gymnopilus junonius]|uniref:Uncharacterized protein n=1 Tax=Gymnopilus junonius TaxID=109634 RepID=A0A9P5NVM9_GYMJU|nr:hypothetical protein CPB84DRAFT_1844311 [Gymnopilus junonius]
MPAKNTPSAASKVAGAQAKATPAPNAKKQAASNAAPGKAPAEPKVATSKPGKAPKKTAT